MKQIFLTTTLCLFSCISNADFETKDPASPEETKAAEEQMRSIGKSSRENSGDTIQLTRSDYLKLIVGNHVHGFKAFDTLVNANDDTVFVVVFHGKGEKEKTEAEQFANYLRKELPVILGKPGYQWAKGVSLTVAIYGEERY